MSRSHPATPRADVYSRITTEIVSAIEAGAGDWRMPWHHDGAATTRPQNVTSRRRYRGVNVLALWIAAEASSYSSGLWGTYRQWAALGAQVRKGERGTTVVFWKQAASRADDDHDDGEAGPGRMFARAFTVFNLAQVEGYEPAPVAVLPESERFAHAEAFVAALKDSDHRRRLRCALPDRSRSHLHAHLFRVSGCIGTDGHPSARSRPRYGRKAQA